MSLKPSYTVQKLRGGFALVWYEGEKRHRRKLYSHDRKSAEAEAKRLWANADSSPWTIGRAVTGYIEALAEDSPPSLQRRIDAWKAMKPFWEKVDPALIDKKMCKDYFEARGIGAATARYELQLISTSLNWVPKEAGLNDAAEIWMPPKPPRKVRHLTHKEFEDFFDAIRAPHVQLYAQIGLYTMARPSAILELCWTQVKFDRQQIEFNQEGRVQTAKLRPTVPINPELVDALLEAFEARQSDYVIEYAGKPIRSVKKAFQAASKRFGEKVTPYMLRHTGAVWAAEAGTPMSELAQYMGHDDDTTTQKHYARYSPDYLKKVSNAVRRRPR